MKSAFRQSMAWLHTWVGLLLSWVLFFIFLTGTVGYFDDELDDWMTPQTPTFSATADDSLPVLEQFLATKGADLKNYSVSFPVDRTQPFLTISYRDADSKRQRIKLNPYTGEELTPRATAGGQTLYRMHYRLRYMPTKIAYYIVGVATMFMFLALITGVVIHKKIFKEFFTFRRGKKPTAWLDGHNLMSVMSLPFHFMITFTGFLLLLYTLMPLIMNAHYGEGKEGRDAFFKEYFSRTNVKASGIHEPSLELKTLLERADAEMAGKPLAWLSVANVGDKNSIFEAGSIHKNLSDSRDKWVFDANNGELIKVQIGHESSKSFYYVLRSLHEGLFASTPLRWLYFLTGLLGTGMIASGMVLWTVKRRTKAIKSGGGSFGYRFTEGLNLACLLGLPAGIAMYLIANRVLPLELSERTLWEVNSLFITFSAFILVAVAKAIAKKADSAWVSLTFLTGFLYVLVPIVNAITTEHNLLLSVLNQNWVFVGVDAVCITVAMACFVLGNYLNKIFNVKVNQQEHSAGPDFKRGHAS
ncbi:hypothetical protein C1E24_20680 [Pseudoalteromonas phenolica]|uniref:PepSY domain-containing protein n=1 Tax=Pseudoalteromonas phenolica TaxID=161398 RepID=A0A5R9PW30_9GAMM|nr:PepSY-associated TM helix domain-containing protein [Pseudoalteromonas phenolica]TLX45110.1 hypothetical protein C1E24_20680 [Pseudoalteromonas phenolica]